METIFDDVGTRINELIDLLDIEPDMIVTKGLDEHKEIVKKMKERDWETLEKYKREIENPYCKLEDVLQRAFNQASKGKGKERHGGDLPFGDQPMQIISELLKSERGLLFQAMKKIVESQRLDEDASIEELLGAIVYIAGAIIYKEQN